jgi:protein cornichon
VIPEILLRVIPTIFFMIYGHWILVLLNIAFDAWYIIKFLRKPASHIGLFDPAEILNRGELKSHLHSSMIKLGEHLVFFFVYLYW